MLRRPRKDGLQTNGESENEKMAKLPPPEDRIPVIVGVGEITDRPAEIAAGLEPLALLEEALRRAEKDSGADCWARSSRSTSSIS